MRAWDGMGYHPRFNLVLTQSSTLYWLVNKYQRTAVVMCVLSTMYLMSFWKQPHICLLVVLKYLLIIYYQELTNIQST